MRMTMGQRPLRYAPLLLWAGVAMATMGAVNQDGCQSEDDGDGDGYTTSAGDCDDTDATVYPGAPELCDAADNDCDGALDEGLPLYYPDEDGDGSGDSSVGTCDALSGYVTNDDDCDDAEPATHPGALEVCDGMDNDCDGGIDEALAATYYQDADGDGYGNPNTRIDACSPPAGYVTNGTDCNDANAAVHPGAQEVCNGLDDDCDGAPEGEETGELEPNDQLASAQDLGDLNGSSTVVTFTLEGTLGSSSDPSDFYKFYLVDDFALGADQFYVEATLSRIASGANYDLHLWWDDPEDYYLSDIREIAASMNSSNFDEYLRHNGESGPENGGYFWIEVRRVSGSSCTQPYTLTLKNLG